MLEGMDRSRLLTLLWAPPGHQPERMKHYEGGLRNPPPFGAFDGILPKLSDTDGELPAEMTCWIWG